MLTYHGTELLPHAERMLELQARMVVAMGQTDAFSGMLRIGVIETVAHTWLPDLFSRFAERYPNATLNLVCDITPRLRDDLLRGTLKVAGSFNAATAAASCRASGADRLVIDVPNSRRESSSSCGSAGVLVNPISGLSA